MWPVSTFEKRKKGKTFFVSTFLDCYNCYSSIKKSLKKVDTSSKKSLEKVDTLSKKSLEKVDTLSKKSLEKVDTLSKKSLEKVLVLDYTLDILDKELKSYAEKKS